MYVYVCICMCVSVRICKVCTAFCMWFSDKIIYPNFRSAWNFCDLICMYVLCMYVCINVLCMYMYVYESVCMSKVYRIYRWVIFVQYLCESDIIYRCLKFIIWIYTCIYIHILYACMYMYECVCMYMYVRMYE